MLFTKRRNSFVSTFGFQKSGHVHFFSGHEHIFNIYRVLFCTFMDISSHLMFSFSFFFCVYFVIKSPRPSLYLYRRLYKIKNMVSINFHLDDDLFELLEEYVMDQGRTKKWVLNHAIKEFLQKEGYLE